MAKKRISEEQARKIVQEVADGAKPAVLAKKYGFSLGTYYNWRAKFGSKKPKAAKKVKAAKKAAPKKRGRKPGRKPAAAKAAPAPAPAAKTTSKKRGRKAAPKKRGRKPGRRKATAAKAAPAGSATAIKAKIVALQGRIKAAQADIAKLKVAYADAIFG